LKYKLTASDISLIAGKLYIIQKLYLKGNLSSYLKDHREILSSNKYILVQWALQIGSAMNFLETKNV